MSKSPDLMQDLASGHKGAWAMMLRSFAEMPEHAELPNTELIHVGDLVRVGDFLHLWDGSRWQRFTLGGDGDQ